MKNIVTRKVLLAFVSCLIISFIFGACNFGSGREYHDDIHIPLETHQAEIIIREWSFLLGSGAEIYYKTADEEILLGQTSGGDDGYCPFQDGKYSVAVEDNKLTIEWCKIPSNISIPWEKNVFELPSVLN